MIMSILFFVFMWFSLCGLWHEFMHVLEAYRQGACEHCIFYRFSPFPAGFFSYWGDIRSKSLVSLAGGLYTSLLCFFCMFLFPLFMGVFFILGWVQLCYGVFEMRFISVLSKRDYVRYKYVLYVGVVLLCLLFLVIVR